MRRIAMLAALLVLGVSTSAEAQQVAPSCASQIPLGLTGDTLAVARASAAKADQARSQLPAGTQVAFCNTAVQTLEVPAGVNVPPAPGFRAAHPRQSSGTTYLGFVACSITGQGSYVHPTDIWVSMWYSCSAIYQSMSGVIGVDTPTHGSWIHGPTHSYDNSSGFYRSEFTDVAWFGYHNRDYWEYGYFCIASAGCMDVWTNKALI